MSQAARITLGVAMLLLAAGFMALVPFHERRFAASRAGNGALRVVLRPHPCGLPIDGESAGDGLHYRGIVFFLLSALYILRRPVPYDMARAALRQPSICVIAAGVRLPMTRLMSAMETVTRCSHLTADVCSSPDC
jgi:hypothetical protein